MIEIILVAIAIILYLTFTYIKQLVNKLNFFEEHYLVFNKFFINQKYEEFKKSEEEFSLIKNEIGNKKASEVSKEKLSEFKNKEIDFKEHLARYRMLLEGNLKVLCGQKKINEVIEDYDNYILDLDRIFKKQEMVDKFVSNMKKDE